MFSFLKNTSGAVIIGISIIIGLNFQEFKDSKGKIFILPIDPIEVTSTKIRELLSNNEDVSALLDSDVYQFIKDQNLYQEQ